MVKLDIQKQIIQALITFDEAVDFNAINTALEQSKRTLDDIWNDVKASKR